MDLYANKKIKITKNALTEKELLNLYDKQSDNNTELNLKNPYLKKRFYNININIKSTLELKTNTNLKTNPIKANLKNDNYLSYISPLKAKNSKSFSKVINIPIQDKKGLVLWI
jgi:hypothetical protein